MAAEGKARRRPLSLSPSDRQRQHGSGAGAGQILRPDRARERNSTTTSAETASFWYAKAANVNIAEAQRRLGLLQVRNGPGSATFDMGVENLKKARDQGDSAATDKLKELGQ